MKTTIKIKFPIEKNINKYHKSIKISFKEDSVCFKKKRKLK